MLYLDEVVIHNFKSFKHSVIKFNQGFNCIVGPNGSGKSNICDSLLFALGEMSLRRMRVSSSTQLINSSTKAAKGEVRRAYVRLKFTGDKELEITRSIKSNKKVSYRLNGERTTRQDVIEVLREFNGQINETNTMTQGEITYLLNLNSKERREMIDIAAGIKEFNDKRDLSLKELEKVEQKLNEAKLLLSERMGFLSDLEKEKIDAEKYTALTMEIRQLSYTLLKMRETDTDSKYAESAAQMKEKVAARQKLEKRLGELGLEISGLLNDKDRISKGLNAKSAEVGSTNKILEEVNKNIAINATQLASHNEAAKSAKEKAGTLRVDQKNLRAKEKENAEQIKKLTFELEIKVKDAPDFSAPGQEDSEVGTLTERYNSNYKKVEELETKLLGLSSDFAKFSSEHESVNREVLENHRLMNEHGAKRSTLTSNIKSSKEALASLEKSKSEVEKDLKKEGDALVSLQARLDQIYVENVNLREALVASGKSESGKGAEMMAKELGKGFYGRVQDLCSYDDKYAVAVQSAAGGRFNYFVVDSIDTASKAIELLKSKKQGRASFIPIKEVEARQAKPQPGLKPLLDCLKFDKKYERAFSFIFANTYLVNNIREAQKIGIGSCRFVTVEGDLVEPSGIVSGGSIKAIQPTGSIENKLKKLEAENKETREKISETNATLEMIKKKIANYLNEIMNYDIELKHALAAEDDVNRNLDHLETKVKAQEAAGKGLKDRLDVARAERERTETSIRLLKDENTKLRATIDGIVSVKSKGHRSKAEEAKLQAAREEVEKLKISIASTTKENDMLKARSEELEKEIASEETLLHSANDRIARLEKESVSLVKQKAELQTALEGHDKKTSGMFKELQALEDKANMCGNERGKLSNEAEKLSRELIELEGKKAQLQTRLNDIRAELVSYSNVEALKGANVEELDKKLIIARNEQEKLGAVNMKAPEVYELKKKDVEESQKKMEILESEKTSIMSMIEQIEMKKLGVFTDTFNSVNENFKQLYGHVFDGETYLYLKNPKDPFNSGLEISVELNGKKRNHEELSGGQKSLIALMLVFAIQMRMPMSFYIFDEIDIALDKENSKKLSTLMKELSHKSQFIVVSHNDSLITAADTAIGVVNRANESQVVGVQLASK